MKNILPSTVMKTGIIAEFTLAYSLIIIKSVHSLMPRLIKNKLFICTAVASPSIEEGVVPLYAL